MVTVYVAVEVAFKNCFPEVINEYNQNKYSSHEYR